MMRLSTLDDKHCSSHTVTVSDSLASMVCSAVWGVWVWCGVCGVGRGGGGGGGGRGGGVFGV